MTAVDPEENTAVGLVWGLLDGGQFDAAASLADAARLVWPHSGDLQMLSAWSHALASPSGADAPAAGETPEGPSAPQPDTHDHLAADPRWNDLLATLHQRERLRDERRREQQRREQPQRDAHPPLAPVAAAAPSQPRSGR